jgi:hypothetical protein
MLPAVIPNARTVTYDYDARTHSRDDISVMNLYDHGRIQVSDLALARRVDKVSMLMLYTYCLFPHVNPSFKTERRPIILVAHSLGGIVLKSVRLLHQITNRI